MSWLGVDVGQSSVKAAAWSEDGVELAVASRGYRWTQPEPNGMELDSDAVVAEAFAAIREAAGRAASAGDPVRGLAVSSQGEAFTPLDAAGRALAPAMISGDARAAGDCRRFAADFGYDRLYAATGHTPSALFSLAKLLWLKRRRPEIWRQAARFLCFEDLLHLRLGVTPSISWPMAGRTMLWNPFRHEWEREILDAAGVRPEQLAAPVPSGGRVGIVPGVRARALGLADDVMVASAGHDQVMAALGSGAAEPGQALYAAGSVECITPVLERPITDPAMRDSGLCTYDFPLPGRYASLAYSLTGSNLLDYFLRVFGEAETAKAAAAGTDPHGELLGTMPCAGPTGLLTLPYFTPSGTPYFDADTPAGVYGWRLGLSKGALLQGLLEGIGYEMKLNLSLLERAGIRVDRFVSAGGGSRDERLTQLKADMLDRPIRKVSLREAGCRGAALLAWSAAAGVSADQLPMPPPETLRDIHPDSRRADAYARQFPRWRQWSQTMRNFGENRDDSATGKEQTPHPGRGAAFPLDAPRDNPGRRR